MNGTVLADFTTGANGKYLLSGANVGAGGTYLVEKMPTAGYGPATANAPGTTTANDSNPNLGGDTRPERERPHDRLRADQRHQLLPDVTGEWVEGVHGRRHRQLQDDAAGQLGAQPERPGSAELQPDQQLLRRHRRGGVRARRADQCGDPGAPGVAAHTRHRRSAVSRRRSDSEFGPAVPDGHTTREARAMPGLPRSTYGIMETW
jgi:hypothetical protein